MLLCMEPQERGLKLVFKYKYGGRKVYQQGRGIHKSEKRKTL